MLQSSLINNNTKIIHVFTQYSQIIDKFNNKVDNFLFINQKKIVVLKVYAISTKSLKIFLLPLYAIEINFLRISTHHIII